MKFSYLITIIIFIFSITCNKPRVQYTSTYNPAQYFIRDSIGLFREAEMGDDPDIIYRLEDTTALRYMDSNYLIYSYTIDANRSYQIVYTFHKKRLKEICFDAILQDNSEADGLLDSFSAYYNARYGKFAEDMGYRVWFIANTAQSSCTFIELNDESIEFGYPKLNLTFYSKQGKCP